MILHSSTTGDGDPLVLLHGLFGRSQNFGSLARRLSGQTQVISLDLRNHGASPHADGMRYEDMVADVTQTLDALGVGCASVLGHSMGGKVAMLCALTHPQRVARLIVADIAPVSYRHANASVAAALRALRLEPGLTRAAADAQLVEAVPEAPVRAFLLQNLAFGAQPAWRIGLAEIAADMRLIEGFPVIQGGQSFDGPSLFIRGARSGYVKDAAMPAIMALFPAARVETLGDAGHWLHADRPDAFAASVENFLRSTA